MECFVENHVLSLSVLLLLVFEKKTHVNETNPISVQQIFPNLSPNQNTTRNTKGY